MKLDTDWLQGRTRITPQKTAIIDPLENRHWSYQDLYKRTVHLAYYLKSQGITAGDRVALLSPNHIAYVDLLFACRRIGAIFVPINWRLTEEEIAYIIQNCSPKLLAYHEKYAGVTKKLQVSATLCISNQNYETILAEVSPIYEELTYNMDTPWIMIYTGGTTGKPKGVVLTNRSVFTNSMNTMLSWNLTAEDVTLTVLPMFHSGGLNALTLPILHVGGTVILFPEFDVDRIASGLEELQCSIVLLVPTMYHMLIQSRGFQQHQYSHMKAFLSGGAPCPPSIYKAFQERKLPFKEGYGLTEAGPNNFVITAERAMEKQGSVGKPMMLNRIKLVNENKCEVGIGEVGEIIIWGDHIFDCYWQNEQETVYALQDGWLYTGDLARKDEDGDYYILGRKKDMIITGGENVYPQEIEQIIDQHPKVKDIAVIGIPDQKWGEVVTAVIVPCDDEQLTIQEIEEYCSKKLARYKIPKQIYFVTELPKTHVGKINKKELVLRYTG